MRPIDADKVLKHSFDGHYCVGGFSVFETVVPASVIETAPTIEVVPKELYEQILWERNIAMEQLEEHGIGFASKKE